MRNRFLTAALAAAVVMLSGCASLPAMGDRPPTHAVQSSADDPLGRVLLPQAQAHPGRTGFVPMGDGRVAFGMRAALARAATRSIDIQTFIWLPDNTGTLLFDHVLSAAERGVRVRLLIDDMNTKGSDPTLALLASHPNVELRLYNPFVKRDARLMGFLTDFTRLNHRMHNKSFTVDGVVTVVGGRNISDEYYEIGDAGMIDLDVVAVGEAVQRVSTQFDLFWNSPSAYPAKLIIGQVTPEPRASLAQRAQAIRNAPVAQKYTEVMEQSPLIKSVLAGNATFEWTTSRLVHDDPAKTLSTEDQRELLLLPRLRDIFGKPVRTFDVVSPYFVPGEAGTQALAGLAQSGVRVRVLTNSLAATDEKSVHIGYAKQREKLLRAGVQLLELKPQANLIVDRASEMGQNAKAGLHAKTYTADGRVIFVGSFNMDPRSALLNTEMGLVIDSADMSTQLSAAFDRAYPSLAYRVSLAEDGSLRWEDGTGKVYDTDPESGWFRRTIIQIGTWLPIDWLL